MTAVPHSGIAPALTQPYFEAHHVLTTLWLVVALTTVAIELAGAGRRRREATQRDRGSHTVIRLSALPGALVLVLAPTIAPAATIHPPLVSAVAGLVLFSAGEALRVWSKFALGRYFTYTVQTSSDQPVITSGPYRALRHPSYTGLLLIAIGVGGVWGNWLGLGALTLGVFLGLAYRISVEEKALLLELGDRYRDYAKHHKRLIPFIW